MSEAHYLAIWEFQVKADCVAEFERIYGQEGLWAQLFSQSSKYLGTELARDLDRPGRFLTIDRWTSRESLQKFKQQFAVEYAALDKTCEQLTESEAVVGVCESIVPERPRSRK